MKNALLAAAIAALFAQGAAAQRRMCPAVYLPVCAATPDGKTRTYTNECEARIAGATMIRRGGCGDAQGNDKAAEPEKAAGGDGLPLPWPIPW